MSKHEKVLRGLRVGKKVDLAKLDPGATEGVKGKKEAREILERTAGDLDMLQYKLYAEAKTALLVVFQAMDTGGKDGVIRKVFGPLNPQGVVVNPFKRPTPVEMAHDYLWRVHANVPPKGTVGIFNRSHYEDVLVARVHNLVPEKVIRRRYEQINAFERYLVENDVVILKFFLHISRDEQKKRLEERLNDPDKNWKFEMNDLAERKCWDKYQKAYETMMERCSPSHAPWHVIPANNKWYRDWAVAELVCECLRKLNSKFPKPQEGLASVVVE